MIPQIILKLVKNPKVIAGFVIGLLVIGVLGYQFIQINVYKNQVTVLQSKNAELKAAIEVQNQRIAEWKRTGDEQRAKLEQAKKDLLQIQLKYNNLKEQIDSMPPPQTCQGAMEWLKKIAPVLAK